MASVQQISGPSLEGPNPVENCIELCFIAEDIIDKPSFQPIGCFVMEDGVAPYEDGDVIIFAGVKIIIGDEPPGDGGSGIGELPLTSTDLATNIQVLLDWFAVTYPFNIDTEILVGGFGNIASVCVRWCQYGPRENFIFQQSDELSNILAWADGTSAEVLAGFNFVYQLMCLEDDLTDAKSICKMQPKPFSFAPNGEPQTLCIDFQNELSNQVSTTPPKCDDPILDNNTMWKWAQVKYGFVQRNPKTNCGNIYGPFQDSDPFLVINQAINLEDGENGVDCYRFNENLGEIEFLTSKDVKRIVVCGTNCEWLFISAFWQAFNTDFVSYHVEYTFYDETGAPLLSFTRPFEDDGVLQIPAGPENILEVYFPIQQDWPDIICSYDVSLLIETSAGIMPYSETATFVVDHNCCCDFSIYYLDSKGGYSRLGLDCVVSRDFIDTATEICLDTKCGSFEEDLMSGKSMIDGESYTAITLTTKILKKTDETMCELRAFKASQKKFYHFTDKKGGVNNRSLVSAGGSTRIMQKDGKVVLTLTMIEGQNYNTISQS